MGRRGSSSVAVLGSVPLREGAGGESGVVREIQELEENLWVPGIEVGVGYSCGATGAGGPAGT